MILLKHSCKGKVSSWQMAQSALFKANLRRFSSFQVNYDPKNDFYSVLGVKPEDDEKTMKKAYYKLAQMYHPDKDPSHEEKFKNITNAYDVLKNEKTKRAYDQAREVSKNPNSSGTEASQGKYANGYNPFGGNKNKG